MEVENLLKYIERITLKLQDIEKNNQETSIETINWINEITDPLYKLLDDIISLLSDPITSQTTRKELYHLLKKFLEIPCNDKIKAQLLQNPKCLHTIIFYISLCDSKNKEIEFAVEVFYVFIYLFSFNDFMPLIDEDCMNGLFEGLSFISEEKLLLSFINILIDINCEYSSESENLFLKVYHFHENARLIDETILRILNSEDVEDNVVINVLYTVNSIMLQEKRNVFYSTDLETFIDIAFIFLNSKEDVAIKLFTLQALSQITSFDDYYRNSYKIDELNELMELCVDNEDLEEVLRNFAQTILDNLQSQQY